MSFYGLEQPIITHLIASCASVAFVAGVPDPAAIERNLQYVQETGAPEDKHGAVFVCAHPDYLGVIASTGRGECQLNQQRWVLAIATREQRNVETANDGQASPARTANGPLVVEVMQAMERFKWTAVGDKREGMRDIKRVDLGSLPGVMLYATDGVYMTLLCYESDLTGTTSTQPGVSYPTLTAPQVDALIAQAIADHEADPDPHPQYTTEAEALAIAQSVSGGPTAPVLSYGVGGALSRIDYADASFKLFSYDADRLDHIDYTKGGITTRKTLAYNGDGTLHSVTPSTL